MSMTERGGGRIVNGLSAGGFMPGGIYGVSKYALHGLTCNLAAELGSRGINVNGIAPGLVDNESGYVSLPKDSPFREILGAQIPGKTSGPPADLIGTCFCCAHRRASGSTARRSRSTAAGSCGSEQATASTKELGMSEWLTRDDRQAVARAEYERIMTTSSPDPSGAFIEAGVVGFVFGEMWRRGVLTPETGGGSRSRASAQLARSHRSKRTCTRLSGAGTSHTPSSMNSYCISVHKRAGPRHLRCRCTEW